MIKLHRPSSSQFSDVFVLFQLGINSDIMKHSDRPTTWFIMTSRMGPLLLSRDRFHPSCSQTEEKKKFPITRVCFCPSWEDWENNLKVFSSKSEGIYCGENLLRFNNKCYYWWQLRFMYLIWYSLWAGGRWEMSKFCWRKNIFIPLSFSLRGNFSFHRTLHGLKTYQQSEKNEIYLSKEKEKQK